MRTENLHSSGEKVKTETGLPPTSLVICSRNRPKLLFETLDSVLQGRHVPAEIIVVDQSSEPNPFLPGLPPDRGCEIRYIHSTTVGASMARNVAIAAACNEILVFMDDDMFATHGWLINLVGALIEAGPGSIVTGQVLSTTVEAAKCLAPSTKSDREPAIYQGRIGADVLFTGNMGVYRSVFAEVGAFDERLGPGTAFPSAEDNDLGFRLLESGYRIHYIPEAVLYHRAWRSKREHLVLRWGYGVGRGAYYTKYIRSSDRHMLVRMARDIQVNLLAFILHLRGDLHLAFGYLLVTFGLIYGAIHWRVRQTRKAPS